MKTKPNEELFELESIIERMPRENVAYHIINQFMRIENPSDDLCDRFHRWLVSPRNAEAKEIALTRCFEEWIGNDTPFRESVKRGKYNTGENKLQSASTH